jgi:hypothetical protein
MDGSRRRSVSIRSGHYALQGVGKGRDVLLSSDSLKWYLIVLCISIRHILPILHTICGEDY